jgi:hypothetical protein
MVVFARLAQEKVHPLLGLSPISAETVLVPECRLPLRKFLDKHEREIRLQRIAKSTPTKGPIRDVAA